MRAAHGLMKERQTLPKHDLPWTLFAIQMSSRGFCMRTCIEQPWLQCLGVPQSLKRDKTSNVVYYHRDRLKPFSCYSKWVAKTKTATLCLLFVHLYDLIHQRKKKHTHNWQQSHFRISVGNLMLILYSLTGVLFCISCPKTR